MAEKKTNDVRFCGRRFTSADMALVRSLIAENPDMHRAGLSRAVCEKLGWLRQDGRLKDMSCRVAMLRMHRAGLITLPPTVTENGNQPRRIQITSASDPQFPISLPAGDLGPLEFQPIETRRDSILWNEFIERYHYLGYQTLPGAQLRFFVTAASQLLALLGFGASAWKVAPRDRWIGWTAEERTRQLHLIVNNARFLILPWIESRNLASRILGCAARQLPEHWQERYGYRPVLLETFVERDRFQGTCYRAANWNHVGQTQGRGKLDRKCEFPVPIKDIYLLPLRRDFRSKLQITPSEDVDPEDHENRR